MANLLPNAVYHSKAVIKSCAYGDKVSFGMYPTHTVPLSDTGVFVRNTLVGSMGTYAICGINPIRITTPYYTSGSLGGINMDVVPYTNYQKCLSFGIAGTGQASTAGIANLYIGPAFTTVGTLESSSTAKKVGSIPVDTILSTGSTGSKLSLTVDKTEICYANSSKTRELVYITGVSMLCTMDGNIMDDVSFIIARAIPVSGTGFINVEQSGGGSTNGSFIFTTDGSAIDCISGDNISSLSSGTISQAIPDDAMVSNDGLAAVSCMASGDGEARWLGYKNGIYKIYQGPTPHYGMPGERVTIKGHEFVCIVYGPFYARLS